MPAAIEATGLGRGSGVQSPSHELSSCPRVTSRLTWY